MSIALDLDACGLSRSELDGLRNAILNERSDGLFEIFISKKVPAVVAACPDEIFVGLRLAGRLKNFTAA